MLRSLRVENLTVFAKANIEFSPNLNVIVGVNGVGKSHLLKVPYSILSANYDCGMRNGHPAPTKALLQPAIAEKLTAVLRPEKLGRLARRRQGHARCEIAVELVDNEADMKFSFSTNSENAVAFNGLPTKWIGSRPVFLPTRELLTIPKELWALYERFHVPIEENLLDTYRLLESSPMRGGRDASISLLIKELEDAMGGKVVTSRTGAFYLDMYTGGRMEMSLVAEGLRKFAMLAILIANGSLLTNGYLFWDEPESNLNPKLIRHIAATVLGLAEDGVQVFLATHSLFLLREFEILTRTDRYRSVKTQYIGLHMEDDRVLVEQGPRIKDIGDIAALDEELQQSGRYLETMQPRHGKRTRNRG